LEAGKTSSTDDEDLIGGCTEGICSLLETIQIQNADL
jgi:hypothetical protein